MKERKEYKYLVLGHPRSGTAYMSALFHYNGIDIRHEQMGKDGTSNWQMVVRDTEYPYPMNCGDKITRDQVTFRRIIHVMRNPVDVIQSTAHTEANRSWTFRQKHIGHVLLGNQLERATESYYHWTKMIQAGNEPMIKVQAETAHKQLCLDRPDRTGINSRDYKKISRKELIDSLDIGREMMFYWLESIWNHYRHYNNTAWKVWAP